MKSTKSKSRSPSQLLPDNLLKLERPQKIEEPSFDFYSFEGELEADATDPSPIETLTDCSESTDVISEQSFASLATSSNGTNLKREYSLPSVYSKQSIASSSSDRSPSSLSTNSASPTPYPRTAHRPVKLTWHVETENNRISSLDVRRRAQDELLAQQPQRATSQQPTKNPVQPLRSISQPNFNAQVHPPLFTISTRRLCSTPLPQIGSTFISSIPEEERKTVRRQRRISMTSLEKELASPRLFQPVQPTNTNTSDTRLEDFEDEASINEPLTY